MKLKVRKETVIDVSDWDNLVIETYGKTYSFQQQDGCKDRQRESICVPEVHAWDYKNDTVPEVVNHAEMGVSFAAWVARDPTQNIDNNDEWRTNLWWERNFYPHVSMIANDLHSKGLIDAGEYVIDIDW